MEEVSNNQVTDLMACSDVPFSNSALLTGRLVSSSYFWSLYQVLRPSISSQIPGLSSLIPKSRPTESSSLLVQKPMPLSASYVHHQKYRNLWLKLALVTNGYIPLILFTECWEKTRKTLLLLARNHHEYKVFDILYIHLPCTSAHVESPSGGQNILMVALRRRINEFGEVLFF